jgi:hypothetical protein
MKYLGPFRDAYGEAFRNLKSKPPKELIGEKGVDGVGKNGSRMKYLEPHRESE